MFEYAIKPAVSNLEKTEAMLNEMAGQGWRVVNATDHLVYFEREKEYEEIDYDQEYMVEGEAGTDQ